MSLQGNAVRSLDSDFDWTMGPGAAGYLQGNTAVAQQIRCRILQVLTECFWDRNAGINWPGFLGSKDPNGLALALGTVVLNTVNVKKLNSLDFQLDPLTREFSVQWNVDTIFSKNVSGVVPSVSIGV